MSITSKINEIRSTLPAGVTLVAVSKTHPAEAIREAYDGGHRIFGESRPQELKAKYEALPHDIEWHMIGHLQTNKVKYIAPFVSMIHSVDSLRLMEVIDREARKCDRKIDCLLEIHVAREQSKTGWEYADLLEEVRRGAFAQFGNVRVRGVMCIATNTEDEAIVRADFERLVEYRNELAPHFGEAFNVVSMGMSDDYPLAVECGSTMVRVGSKIFGYRNYL
ncbi:MAG: YggS family pyridoxal phosphate-dependent enzyme [Alistipes sp.]|nr:YggS family pyridoxal phosphate-dependent enzyme [Alistipes sp.]